MKVTSLNNKIMCSPYKGELKIKSSVKSGFAAVEQKISLVELEVVSDARISHSLSIKKGSKVLISEEIAFNKAAKQKGFTTESIKEPFILVELFEIVGVIE